MTKFKIEHMVLDKSYTLAAETEQDAWEYFLDHMLKDSEMAEQYTIYPC